MKKTSLFGRHFVGCAIGLAFLVSLPAKLCAAEAFPKEATQQAAYIQRFVEPRLLEERPKIDDLEAFARELRKKVESHQTYERALGTYYWYLGFHAGGTFVKPKVTMWQQSRPTSPTPALVAINSRVVMAMGDLMLAISGSFVWHEPPQARSEFEAIRRELLSVKSYASEDPFWYVLMAQTLIALRLDRAEMDKLVDEGLRKNPKNYELILTATAAHLSKWGGDAESLERYAQRVLALSAPDDGVSNYARIYNVALRAQYGVMLFDLSKADWNLLMSASRELAEKASLDSIIADTAVLACAGGNRALTREMLRHPNFTYNDASWYNIGTSWHPYKICREWASMEVGPAVERKNEVEH
jgi:hypothetical protein